MRIRSTKPEFWQDERMARELSRETRLLYKALWNEADDYGRLRGNENYLHGTLFPYDPGDWFHESMEQLKKTGRVVPYEAEGGTYLYLTKFVKHQRIDHPSKSVLPDPPEGLASPRETLARPSRPTRAVARSREQGAGSREQGVFSRGPRESESDPGTGKGNGYLDRYRALMLEVRAVTEVTVTDLDRSVLATWSAEKTAEVVTLVLDRFVRDDDPWLRTNGWALRELPKRANGYLAAPPAEDKRDGLAAAWAGRKGGEVEL